MNSLNVVIEFCRARLTFALLQIDEKDEVLLDQEVYRPLPFVASWYDYLRYEGTRELIGVDLQLGSLEQAELLTRLKWFVPSPVEPRMAGHLRFMFPDTRVAPTDDRIISDWDQILSQNPFQSGSGQVLLILQTSHLLESDRGRLSDLCNRFPRA